MKLAIGIPAYRQQVAVGHLYQTANLVKALEGSEVELAGILSTDSCSVEWSRNQLVHTALKNGADWLLMCDADTYHSKAGDLLEMMREGQRRGAAVIAAPVKQRGSSGHHNVVVVEGNETRRLTPFEFAGKVLPVQRIGTACMAVSLGWVKDHWPEQPWFQMVQLPGPEPKKVGEDFLFCEHVGDRGGLILADGRFEPVHVGA